MRLLTIIFILIPVFSFSQQVKLRLVDNSDESPISDATIKVNGKRSIILISNQEGEVEFEYPLPVKIEIRHLAYEEKEISLSRQGLKVIRMQAALTALDEVVVTGQFEAQSVLNSVYQVRSINSERIDLQSPNSVEEILSRELNLRFGRDNATGSSNLSMQGISGQNVKVLIDGVPMVGRSGTANEIDLAQINVNSIERIEIVEGPMSVNYGSDALAGVINIITKKKSDTPWEIGLRVREETVGDEYSIWEDGHHNYYLSGRVNFNKWFTRLEGGVNRFGGWTGSGEGRSKEWYPKTQFLGTALLGYGDDNWNVYYRLDLLDEKLENLGEINDNNPLRDPFAQDVNYNTQRWMHQVQGEFDLKVGTLQAALSYSDYDRVTHEFTTNMVTDQETDGPDSEQDTIRFDDTFLRLVMVNPILEGRSNVNISTQLGVDMKFEQAEGTTISDGEKNIQERGLFVSSEIGWKKFKTRIGARLVYHSLFSAPITPSVHFKFNLNSQSIIRASYGRGFRAPSTRELYHEFIDANHNILGNENLEPEYSHNVQLDIDHNLVKIPINLNLTGFFNYIDNRITFFTPEEANQATTYTNLLEYKTLGGTFTGTYQNKGLKIKTGFSYIGRYQLLNEEFDMEVPEYVFSPEVLLQINYETAFDIKAGLYFKYTGSVESYFQTLDEDGNEQIRLSKIDGFSMMDLNLSKSWKSLTFQGGIRNLLDVTNVNFAGAGASVHGGGNGGLRSISYGRSYYLGINLKLN